MRRRKEGAERKAGKEEEEGGKRSEVGRNRRRRRLIFSRDQDLSYNKQHLPALPPPGIAPDADAVSPSFVQDKSVRKHPPSSPYWRGVLIVLC